MNTKTTSCTTEYIGKRPDWYKGKPIVCWVGSDFKGGTKVIVSDPLTLNRFLIENMQSREVRAYRDGHRIASVTCNPRRTRWSRHIDLDVWNEVPDHLKSAIITKGGEA